MASKESKGRSWTTTTAQDRGTDSLKARARKRTAYQDGENRWTVVGDQRGDAYDYYSVTRVDEEMDRAPRFVCSCYGHGSGDVRARRGCSHVWRVRLGLGEDEGGEGQGFEDRGDREDGEGENLQAEVEGEVEGGVEGFFASPPTAPATPPTPTDMTDDEIEDLLRQALNDPELQAELASLDHDLFDPYAIDPDTVPLPSQLRVSVEEPPMPAKFQSFRYRDDDPDLGSDQWQAIVECVQALQDGMKVVFVDAPTGAGKTLIAESVGRLMGVPRVYTCITKPLQEQVEKDFGEYAKVLKGRANYPTLDDPERTADDCTRVRKLIPACAGCPSWGSGDSWKLAREARFDDPDHGEQQTRRSGWHCESCHPVEACPYRVAKDEAVHARLSILNLAYYLNECRGQYSQFSNRPLVLIDEGSQIEDELLRFVEVSVTPRVRKELGVGLPAKKTVDEAWVHWIAGEVIPAIDKQLDELKFSPRDLFGKVDLKVLRKQKRLRNLKEKLGLVIVEVENDEGSLVPVLSQGWVYTGYEKKRDEDVTVTFKPVKVDRYAREALWMHADQFVLFDATWVSVEQTARDLGLEDDEWIVVTVPSSFDVRRRPIVPRTVVRVAGFKNDRDKKLDAYRKLSDEVEKVLGEHARERVLIHTVSYELAQHLRDDLQYTEHRHRVKTYRSANERMWALDKFLEDQRGVLIAPSFERGIDLHGDDCRVIVVAKIPFPYLGDKQVSTRYYGTGSSGKTWYLVETIRSLCQMTGRGMRSETDWCVTYVLDESFSSLYRQNKRLFPGWWSDAIVWDENDPKWREAVVVGDGGVLGEMEIAEGDKDEEGDVRDRLGLFHPPAWTMGDDDETEVW